MTRVNIGVLGLGPDVLVLPSWLSSEGTVTRNPGPCPVLLPLHGTGTVRSSTCPRPQESCEASGLTVSKKSKASGTCLSLQLPWCSPSGPDFSRRGW